MAGDDVLWKQVEDLKAHAPEKAGERTAAPAGKQTLQSTRRTAAKRARNPSPIAMPSRSASRLAARPASQSTASPSSAPANGQQLGGRVVARPVSFYIPLCIDAKIDDAVDYLEKRHGVKVDRSAVVSAILGESALWEVASLNQLVDKTMQQLTNRLTSRLISRPGS